MQIGPVLKEYCFHFVRNSVYGNTQFMPKMANASRSPSREPKLLLRGKRQAKFEGLAKGVHKGLGVAPQADWGIPFKDSLDGVSAVFQTKKQNTQGPVTRSQGMYKLEQQSQPPEIALSNSSTNHLSNSCANHRR